MKWLTIRQTYWQFIFNINYGDFIEIKKPPSFTVDNENHLIEVKNEEVEIILKEALDEKTAKIKAIEYLETWFKYATLVDNDFLPKFKLQKTKKVVMNSNERIIATTEDSIYGQLTIIREKDKFITYPKTFCFDECTKILAKRYTDYMEGKEKLISFANFLRSLLNDFKVKKTKEKNIIKFLYP